MVYECVCVFMSDYFELHNTFHPFSYSLLVRGNQKWCTANAGQHVGEYYAYFEGMVLYSAVSNPLDRSKRFTLFLPWQTCSFQHQLGVSWKHSGHAAIAQRLFTHISITVYSQVLIYTAESTEASWRERKWTNFETAAKGIRTRALSLRVRHSTTELPRSTTTEHIIVVWGKTTD